MLNKIEYFISKIKKKLRLRAIKNSCIDRSSSIAAGSQFINSNIKRNSYCGYDCMILNCDIGSFCSIASYVTIGGANHTIEWISTSPVFNCNKDQIKKKYSFHKFNTGGDRTIIKNDVWIGNNVLIKQGVIIENGAIIGMGSVVTKDVGAYEIWAGNPAKLIRKRFSDNIINQLNNICWWDFEDEILEKYAKYIKEPEIFIEKVKGE